MLELGSSGSVRGSPAMGIPTAIQGHGRRCRQRVRTAGVPSTAEEPSSCPRRLEGAILRHWTGRPLNGARNSSNGSEPKIEAHPARDAVVYCYAASMRPDDLHNDREA